MAIKDRTTIVLERKVRERLAKRGTKGESYTDIVKRLLDQTEPKQQA